MLGCRGAVVRAGGRQLTRALGGSTRTPGNIPDGSVGVAEKHKTASFSSPDQANITTRMYPTLEKVSVRQFDCLCHSQLPPRLKGTVLENDNDVLYAKYVLKILYCKLLNLNTLVYRPICRSQPLRLYCAILLLSLSQLCH